MGGYSTWGAERNPTSIFFGLSWMLISASNTRRRSAKQVRRRSRERPTSSTTARSSRSRTRASTPCCRFRSSSTRRRPAALVVEMGRVLKRRRDAPAQRPVLFSPARGAARLFQVFAARLAASLRTSRFARHPHGTARRALQRHRAQAQLVPGPQRRAHRRRRAIDGQARSRAGFRTGCALVDGPLGGAGHGVHRARRAGARIACSPIRRRRSASFSWRVASTPGRIRILTTRSIVGATMRRDRSGAENLRQ